MACREPRHAGFAKDRADAARRALGAGLDMEMASGVFPEHLARLVKEGAVPTAQLDDGRAPRPRGQVRAWACSRSPYVDEAARRRRPRRPRAPRRGAPRRAAVDGAAAEREEDAAAREDGGEPRRDRPARRLARPTPRARGWCSATCRRRSPCSTASRPSCRAAKITYAPGPEIRRQVPVDVRPVRCPARRSRRRRPSRVARPPSSRRSTRRSGADVVIAVMGELANMSGEAASRASLDLPGRQEELLKAVVALGKPVVLVLLNGRPLSINWAAENVPAILEAWQPGTEGGHAVADVLFGDAVPGGKLPVTLPALRRPRAALLRAQPDPLARGLADVQRRATGTAPRRRSTRSATG